jgi:hypothetical protein
VPHPFRGRRGDPVKMGNLPANLTGPINKVALSRWYSVNGGRPSGLGICSLE